MNAHEKWLRQAAEEIRREGHNGWGNTCEQAADEIASLQKRVIELEKALGSPRRASDER